MTDTTTRAVHEDFASLVHQLKAALLDDDNPALPRGELQELVTEAAVALIEYKGLARESAVAVEGCRAEMQAKKREVDERHLQLQNLLYEKDHLQRTIQTLRDFPLKELAKMEREEGVPLLPGLSEGGGGEGRLLSMEEHRQNMETLRAEKETRLRLHQEHAAAQTKRAALADELNKLKEMLATTLPRQIEELDTLCSSIHERMPDLPVAAPFGGFPVDDVRALPQALYILLGRLHAYAQAFDPEESQVKVSIVACEGGEGGKVVLPPSLVVAGTEAARLASKQVGSSRMEVEGEEGEEGGVGAAVVTVVDARAIQLEFSPLKVEGGMEEGKEGKKDVLVFYFAVSTRELLVSAPGRHPHALVNLLPGDTGGVSPSSSSSSPPSFSSSSTTLKFKSKRRTTSKKSSSSSSSSSSSVAQPMSFMWLSWLGGTSPFPPHFMDLGAAYTSTCILNRLRVRLRAQRLLDQMFEILNLKPREAGREGAVGGGWVVSSFVEVGLAGVLEEGEEGREGGMGGDPFEEVPCGVQEAGGEGEGGREEEEAMMNVSMTVVEENGGGGKEGKEGKGGELVSSRQQQAGAAGGGGGGGGGEEAWERAGARYFEITLKKEGEGGAGGGGGRKDKSAAAGGPTVKVLVEVTPEYPIRPPRFRLFPSSSSSASSSSSDLAKQPSFQDAFSHVLVEVNAHYEELLLEGGREGGRDWLLSHQLQKLLFCLNTLGDLTEGGVVGGGVGSAAGRLRWGKDRRRSYTFDVHCALLIPR